MLAHSPSDWLALGDSHFSDASPSTLMSLNAKLCDATAAAVVTASPTALMLSSLLLLLQLLLGCTVALAAIAAAAATVAVAAGFAALPLQVLLLLLLLLLHHRMYRLPTPSHVPLANIPARRASTPIDRASERCGRASERCGQGAWQCSAFAAHVGCVHVIMGGSRSTSNSNPRGARLAASVTSPAVTTTMATIIGINVEQ